MDLLLITLTVMVLITTGLLLFLCVRRKTIQKRVWIVVLGDIGRSPRMQYHALSFAREGFDVTFVGYPGSLPHQNIRQNPKINLRYLKQPPTWLDNIPRLLKYGIKVVWQVLDLVWTLVLCPRPRCLLVQNPPALPTLAVCWLAGLITKSDFLIDWHNYGYTILALTAGQSSPLVKFARLYERYFGRLSSANICVTNAMREDLRKHWQIVAETMYDRPPVAFEETDVPSRHELFLRLGREYKAFRDPDSKEDATIFTSVTSDNQPQLRSDRPALLISSTSWTEDEDFSILLKALQRYEDYLASCDSSNLLNLPKLTCVITGKGPLKEYYKKEISKRTWSHVKVETPWLEAEDYPKLLGSADLGVSLHKSSSDLDLPMKVVDMFGCGVPVCAVDFKCLNELVKHEQNGLVFNSDEELFGQLKELLTGFPDHCHKLKAFRQDLVKFQKVRWHDAWTQTVLPIVSPQ